MPAEFRKGGVLTARAAAVFFFGFAVFQVALVLGAPLGGLAWGGAAISPAVRFASLGAAAYLLLAAAAMLCRSSDLLRTAPQLPLWCFNAFLALQLALNTVANIVSRSPGERWVMAPASAIGCLLCLMALILLPARFRPSHP